MAGRGTRTRSLGEFKPFIKINGREIVGWALLSLRSKIEKTDQLIFITTDYFSRKFGVEKRLGELLSQMKIETSFKLLTVRNTPPGPAMTVFEAKNFLARREPLIIVNSDQYIDFRLPKGIVPKTGYLPIYAEFGHKSSYVEVKKGLIKRVVEKDNISNLASAGVYLISEATALFDAIETMLDCKDNYKGEYFVGPAFNYIIGQGYKVKPLEVYVKYDLGNPEDIKKFSESEIAKISV